MYRPKVLPGLFSGLIAQRPETENTGGVWLPPRCRPSPQGAPATHAFIRQPGRWQPWQSPSSLSHFSSATHRAGQVCRWCLLHSDTPFPVVWQVVTAFRVLADSQISADCLQVVWCICRLAGWWDSAEAGSVPSFSSSRVWTTQTGTGHAAAAGGFVFMCVYIYGTVVVTG